MEGMKCRVLYFYIESDAMNQPNVTNVFTRIPRAPLPIYLRMQINWGRVIERRVNPERGCSMSFSTSRLTIPASDDL